MRAGRVAEALVEGPPLWDTRQAPGNAGKQMAPEQKLYRSSGFSRDCGVYSSPWANVGLSGDFSHPATGAEAPSWDLPSRLRSKLVKTEKVPGQTYGPLFGR